MTPTDAYRRCLYAGPDTTLGRACNAVKCWRRNKTLHGWSEWRAFWKLELITLVRSLHNPDDVTAVVRVAVEEGVATAREMYDAAPGGGMR